MAVRLPTQGIFDVTQTDVSGSVAGGWAYPFIIPQDTDNILVKFTPSVTAGGASALFQTTDDGGTTWYDIARTSIASANGVGQAPQWLSIPVVSSGVRTGATFGGASIISMGIGSSSASTLGSQQISGLPIMGVRNRVFVITTGNATAVSARVEVRVNNQSATA